MDWTVAEDSDYEYEWTDGETNVAIDTSGDAAVLLEDGEIAGEQATARSIATEAAQRYGIVREGQVWQHKESERVFTILSTDQDDVEGLGEEGVYTAVEPADEHENVNLATRLFPQQLLIVGWENFDELENH